MDKRIHATLIFEHPLIWIEQISVTGIVLVRSRHLPGDFGGDIGHIEIGDRTKTGLALDELCQEASVPHASGVTRPTPVTATRLMADYNPLLKTDADYLPWPIRTSEPFNLVLRSRRRL